MGKPAGTFFQWSAGDPPQRTRSTPPPPPSPLSPSASDPVQEKQLTNGPMYHTKLNINDISCVCPYPWAQYSTAVQQTPPWSSIHKGTERERKSVVNYLINYNVYSNTANSHFSPKIYRYGRHATTAGPL